MNTTRRHAFALLALTLLALVATGCRSTRPTPAPTPVVTPTESQYTVMTFSGTVEGISVSGQVRMEHGKVIWCSVSKFIELGRAMATPDSLWVRATMMDLDRKGDYRDLERLSGRRIAFADLEAILLSDDADERIAALGRQLGYNVQVHITRREKADRLTFPFNK
ncbi:MAG: DUF4292 domain-containing protein [Bacteroidales bacterium]|nr:DUF4292 domain-containing protein [Bacteroidales bacterium]